MRVSSRKKAPVPDEIYAFGCEQHVLMGFRMVDDIVANEREHRKSLAKAVAVAEQSYAPRRMPTIAEAHLDDTQRVHECLITTKKQELFIDICQCDPRGRSGGFPTPSKFLLA